MKNVSTDRIESFDVAFCYRDTILSEAITAVTQSKFSHSAVFAWEKNKLMVYDSQIDGFKGKEYHDWVNQYGYSFVIMRNPDLTVADIKDQRTRLESIIGKKYDFLSLLVRKPLNIGRRIANVFRRKDKAEVKQQDALKRLYCSEACAYIIGLENIDLTPNDLFLEVTLEGWRVVR